MRIDSIHNAQPGDIVKFECEGITVEGPLRATPSDPIADLWVGPYPMRSPSGALHAGREILSIERPRSDVEGKVLEGCDGTLWFGVDSNFLLVLDGGLQEGMTVYLSDLATIERNYGPLEVVA